MTEALGSRDLDPWNLATPRVRGHRTRVGKPTGAGTWSPGPAVPEPRGALPEPRMAEPTGRPLRVVELFSWALVVVFPTNKFLPSSPPGPIPLLRGPYPIRGRLQVPTKTAGLGRRSGPPYSRSRGCLLGSPVTWSFQSPPSSSTLSASLEFFSLLDFTPDPRPRFGTKIESEIRRREG